MQTLEALADRLGRLSRRDHQALGDGIDWPEALDPNQWVMSPELTSLHGTPWLDAIAAEDLPRYLLLEAVNFFSLNIHGERHLVGGIARRLHRDHEPEVNDFLHHFLDEENKHMAYFGEFCRRYGGFVYPERGLAFPRDYAAGEEDVLFFAKALLFEELVDDYNARMAGDERLAPVAQRINALHHRDESRHRAFGRRFVAGLHARHAPAWSDEVREGVRAYLGTYLQQSWRAFYNPEVYRAVGFADPHAVAASAWEHEAQRAHRAEVSAGCVRFLLDNGILDREPQL